MAQRDWNTLWLIIPFWVVGFWMKQFGLACVALVVVFVLRRILKKPLGWFDLILLGLVAISLQPFFMERPSLEEEFPFLKRWISKFA